MPILNGLLLVWPILSGSILITWGIHVHMNKLRLVQRKKFHRIKNLNKHDVIYMYITYASQALEMNFSLCSLWLYRGVEF